MYSTSRLTWVALFAAALGGVACGDETDAERNDVDGGVLDGGMTGSPSFMSSCAGDQSSTGTPQQPVGPMIAVGDSILGWNQEEMASIPDVVGQTLNVAMDNRAIGGAEVFGSEGIPTFYQGGTATHVLMNGGGNDFARECTSRVLDQIVSPDLTSGLMVDLIDRVSADGAQAVLIGYYLPRDNNVGCAQFEELMRRYRRLGQTRDDTMFICTLETITPSTPQLYADDVHPNIEGSAAVGRLIAAMLRP
ncbi:MAG: SGNH/GDSL hydrolase family protein [Myxococcota bacterium]